MEAGDCSPRSLGELPLFVSKIATSPRPDSFRHGIVRRVACWWIQKQGIKTSPRATAFPVRRPSRPLHQEPFWAGVVDQQRRKGPESASEALFLHVAPSGLGADAVRGHIGQAGPVALTRLLRSSDVQLALQFMPFSQKVLGF